MTPGSHPVELPVDQGGQPRGAGATPANGPAQERTLRVCHLIGSLRYGGAERQVVNILNHLPFPQRHLLMLEEPLQDGLQHVLDPGVMVDYVPLRMRNLPLSIWRVARLLRRWRIDVLHTHMFWPNLVGAAAAALAGIPVVVTSEHGKNLWKNAGHRWIERNAISPLVQMRFCASEDILRLRRERDGISPEKLLYMPNATALPDVQVRTPHRPPVIGTVGRFVAAKGYDTLIEAVGQLRDQGVACRLVLVGDGPERGRLESRVAELGLVSRVEFTGFQRDIEHWLRYFDVFVLSSVREGQPLALLEAMAHALPVVATRVGGIPSTLEEGQEGLLVESGDAAALADALRTLLADPQMSNVIGVEARRRVEREFSVSALALRYAETYNALWMARYEAGA